MKTKIQPTTQKAIERYYNTLPSPFSSEGRRYNKFLREKFPTQDCFRFGCSSLTSREILDNDCFRYVSAVLRVKVLLHLAQQEKVDAIGILANSVTDYITSFNRKSTAEEYLGKKLALMGIRTESTEPYYLFELLEGFKGYTIRSDSVVAGHVLWYPIRGEFKEQYEMHNTKVITYVANDFEDLDSWEKYWLLFFGQPTHSLPIAPIVKRSIAECLEKRELFNILYQSLNGNPDLLKKHARYLQKLQTKDPKILALQKQIQAMKS